MTDLEKAFDEWLLKNGGVNGSVNVQAAFEAGAAHGYLGKIHAVSSDMRAVFAATAMQKMWTQSHFPVEEVAKAAVASADALIEALEAPRKGGTNGTSNT